MKTLISIILSFALLLSFVSCGAVSPNDDNGNSNKTPSQAASLKRDVKYDGYTVASGITLPFESTVIEHVQFEKTLYLLTDGGVYSLNTESGESKLLFEADYDSIAIHSDILYLYSSERGEISSYSLSGELTDSFSSEDIKDWNIKSFVATDNYFVFIRYRYQTEESKAVYQIATVNKISKQLEVAEEIKTGFVKLCPYKDDTVLAVFIDDTGAPDNFLYTYNAKSNKFEKVRKIAYDPASYCYDACYNPKADTIVLLMSTQFQPLCLCEYSIEDDENSSLLNAKVSEWNQGGSVSIYENIVSFFNDKDTEYRYFDYQNPPEHITIAYYSASSMHNVDLAKIIRSYEQENNVIIRTMIFEDEDRENLKIKLMAEDDDIDIFSSISVGADNCINTHTYVNLADFESLGEKISSDVFVDFASKTGEEYFGIPYGIFYTENKHENPIGFSAIEQYCIKNINSETGEYLDESGDELYKVLKYHYENPNGSEEEFYDFPYSTIQTDYLIMNPASKKQEIAADFLEYFFDAMNGDIKLTIAGEETSPIYSPFIELESTDNIYFMWKFQADGVLQTLYNAYHASLDTDGSDKALKDLAKEAARSFKMRLEG
ncbi:MAG: hypothetical protein IJ424_06890 [Oscillospiraceae bacterium]|nr:hypothetical protein [Oscillospiraceae bacterium]